MFSPNRYFCYLLIASSFACGKNETISNPTSQQEITGEKGHSSSTNPIGVFEVYENFEDFHAYALAEFENKDFKIMAQDTLLVIPLNSCGSCVLYTFEKCLGNSNKNFQILISGDTAIFDQYNQYIRQILPGREIHFDLDMSLSKYNVNILGPVLLAWQSQPTIYPLSVEKWEIISPSIGWK